MSRKNLTVLPKSDALDKHSIPAALREEGTFPDPFDFQAKERESGKESLPVLEDLESEYADEPEDESEPVLTEQDKADLPVLEARVTKGCRATFAALREIRNRKLWKIPKDENGNRLYKSFGGKKDPNNYVKARFGFSSQWVTRGLNWLRVMETYDHLGVDAPPLSLEAAQALNPDHVKLAGGLLAVIKEAQEDGLTLTYDHLKDVVDRRSEFFGAGEEKPAANTYEDYHKDILKVDRPPQEDISPRAVLNALVNLYGSKDRYHGIDVTKALAHYGDKVDRQAVADELLRVCEVEGMLPDASDLLLIWTGEALEEVVSRLETVAQNEADSKKELAELEQLKAEKKKLLEADHLKSLSEQIKSREEALIKKGKLKPKQNKRDKDVGGKDSDGQDEVEVPSEVRENLNVALSHITEANAGCEWPDETVENEKILEVIKDIQKELEDVAKQANNALAEAKDTPEPASVPSNS